MTTLILTLSLPLALGGSLTPAPDRPGPQAADSAAVVAAALDYIEGWFAGDGDRMRRSLHPDLVKRIIGPDGALQEQGAERLAASADRKGPDAQQPSMRDSVTILDLTGRSAVVRIDAPRWIDFMHLARFEDGWKIVNVLWETR